MPKLDLIKEALRAWRLYHRLDPNGFSREAYVRDYLGDRP